MGFWDWLKAAPDVEFVEGDAPEPLPEVAPVAELPMPLPPIVGRDETEKVAFHIERFERALEQCTNDTKRADLERNLRYWTGLKALQEGLI